MVLPHAIMNKLLAARSRLALALAVGLVGLGSVAQAQPVPKMPDPYKALFLQIARETGVPVALIAAVAAAESGFDPLARSPKGATGLMQLMPDTARRFNVTNLLSPEQNLRGGAHYLRWLSERFPNDMERVIAAYNAGESAVDRAGGTPPFPETQAYLPKVMHYFRHFDKLLAAQLQPGSAPSKG
ncbi:MAG: lytic transglycosylase domain-containing protein [Burkholderiales bacterium]|nr:lytic transglycosylase domain-containing protein [Burkholderiales bacterium]